MTTEKLSVLPPRPAVTTPTRLLAACASALALSILTAPAPAQNSLFAPCAQWKTFEQAGLGETLRSQGSITSMVAFDLDGPGPQGESLLASVFGSASIDGQPVPSLMRWTGEAWVPLPGLQTSSGTINLWVIESPDGTGRSLFATESLFGTSPQLRVSRWNGSEFVLFAAAPTTGANSLASIASFDPDGPGPQPRELYFVESGSSALLFRIRNSQRDVVSTISMSAPRLFEYVSADGQQRRLILSGSGTSSSIANFRGIAAFTGTLWEAIGDTLFGTTETSGPAVSDATMFDPDGPGPLPESLTISGYFRVGSLAGPLGLAYLQGQQWVALGSGLVGSSSVGAIRLVPIPANNESTTRPRAVLIGYFTSVDGVPARSVAQLVGQTWQESPLASPSVFPPSPIAAFDADLGGPQAPFVALSNRLAPATLSEHKDIVIASDGQSRQPLRGQFVGGAANVLELRMLADDQGVQRLHAAGEFVYAGDRLVAPVVRLVNGSWESVGTPFSNTFTSIVRHDLDGSGPEPEKYVALGNGSPARSLFALNGETWTLVPTTPASSNLSILTTLESWDPDNQGPGAPVLLASYAATTGLFNPFPGVLVDGVWRPLGVSPTGNDTLSKFAIWDADGPGPDQRRLYMNAGGLHRFEPNGTDPAQWGSSPWTRLSQPAFGSGLIVNRAAPAATPALMFDGSSQRSSSSGSPIRQFSAGAFSSSVLGYRTTSTASEATIDLWDSDGDGPAASRPIVSPVFTANMPADGFGGGENNWRYRASILSDGRWFGLGARNTSSTGNGLFVYRPDAGSTREVILQFYGTKRFASFAQDIFVFSADCPCSVADIADDQGNALPGTGPNNGVTEGDYNHFFTAFFTASPTCDIADDQGNPLPAAPNVPNNGVTEADYNCFFSLYFNGCP